MIARADKTAEQHLRGLLRLLHELPTATDPADAVEVILRFGVDSLKGESAALATFVAPEELRAVVTRGPVRHRLALGGRLLLSRNVPVTVAARERRPLWIESRQQYMSEFPEAFAPDMPVTPAQSVCALPLVLAGVVLGTLLVTFQDERRFSELEREFLLGLADLCVLWLSARSQRTGFGPTRPSDLLVELAAAINDLRAVVAQSGGRSPITGSGSGVPETTVPESEDGDVPTLTHREESVLELMAEGLTNAGIADRLFISEKSVERAVTAIFRKFELTRRRDIDRRVVAALLYRTRTAIEPG